MERESWANYLESHLPGKETFVYSRKQKQLDSTLFPQDLATSQLGNNNGLHSNFEIPLSFYWWQFKARRTLGKGLHMTHHLYGFPLLYPGYHALHAWSRYISLHVFKWIWCKFVCFSSTTVSFRSLLPYNLMYLPVSQTTVTSVTLFLNLAMMPYSCFFTCIQYRMLIFHCFI